MKNVGNAHLVDRLWVCSLRGIGMSGYTPVRITGYFFITGIVIVHTNEATQQSIVYIGVHSCVCVSAH